MYSPKDDILRRVASEQRTAATRTLDRFSDDEPFLFLFAELMSQYEKVNGRELAMLKRELEGLRRDHRQVCERAFTPIARKNMVILAIMGSLLVVVVSFLCAFGGVAFLRGQETAAMRGLAEDPGAYSAYVQNSLSTIEAANKLASRMIAIGSLFRVPNSSLSLTDRNLRLSVPANTIRIESTDRQQVLVFDRRLSDAIDLLEGMPVLNDPPANKRKQP